MEINKRLILKENVDSDIRSNDTLRSPEPGVAYVYETDKVYFNNAVLPQGGGPVVPQEADVLNSQPLG